MGDLTIINTSREANVTEMLMGMPGWRKWFPDSPMLLARTMLDGAGQIRTLSRLAFSDLLLDNPNGIPELERAIDNLRNEEGQPNDGFKIMIVSSFAGGTGAGMFLQMPLYLRQRIRAKYPGIPVMIRGLFALPDVFMGQELNSIQEESMYANAYACLKELSAINNICLSNDESMSQYDLQIGDLFDSKSILAGARKAKEENKLNEIPTAGRKPYDFIFFVDNNNSNNNTISSSSPEVYIEQMADITYMQVYSPMANTTDSREDNLILTRMITNGKSMYGSAASTILAYPYDDILEYFSAKATREMITKRWRYIDTQYEKQRNDLKRLREYDPSIQDISRGEGFLSQADDLMKNKSSTFSFLRNVVYEKNADRKLIPKSERFVSAIENAIAGTIAKDEDLEEARITCTNWKKQNVQSRKRAIDLIENGEELLGEYQETIESRTQSLYYSVAERFVPDDLDSPCFQDNQTYHIFNLLKMTDDNGKVYGIHPLAVRYLLYSVIDSIQQKLTSATQSLTGTEKAIEQYYQDRDPQTEGHQGPGDVVPETRKKWIFINTEEDAIQYFNNYRDGKIKGFSTQLTTLTNYCKNRLEKAVYQEILKRLQAISNDYEKMFLFIDDIEKNYQTKITKLEAKFKDPGASTSYLCVSPYYLEELYANCDVEIDEGQSNSMFDTILTTIYEDAMKKLKKADEQKKLRKKDIEKENDKLNSSVKKLFDDVILAENTAKIKNETVDLLDINVYEALTREVEFRLRQKFRAEDRDEEEITEQDREKERQDLLMEVYRKSAPYLSYNRYHKADPNNQNDTGKSVSLNAQYWGVNTDVYDVMNKEKKDAAKFLTPTGAKPAEISKSKMYSKYEIQCYRGLYGVQLTEIPKFRESEEKDLQGEFYKNYCRRIRRMISKQYGSIDEGVTPHIDIRWHNRKYLPNIDNTQEQNESAKAARALWLGLMYHNSKDNPCISEELNRKTNKMDAWVCATEDYPKRQILFNGKPIGKRDFYEMYQAFAQDPITTEQVLKNANQLFKADCDLALRTQGDIHFYGEKGAVPFTKALIGNKSEDTPIEEVDEEVQDEAFNTNALEIAARIVKNRQSTPEDKDQIMHSLIAIIDEFVDGVGLSDSRKKDLIWEIFIRSPFVLPKNRRGAEAALIPPFSAAVDKYDRMYNKPKKPSSKKTGKTTEANALDNSISNVGTSAKEAHQTKRSTASKASGTAKKSSVVTKTTGTKKKTNVKAVDAEKTTAVKKGSTTQKATKKASPGTKTIASKSATKKTVAKKSTKKE